MRLIDADALKDYISNEQSLTAYGAVVFKEIVNAQPTVDHVKHGHWVWNPNAYDWNLGAWCCSECGHHDGDLPGEQNPRIPVERYVYSNYCHCCGAKMNQNVTKD